MNSRLEVQINRDESKLIIGRKTYKTSDVIDAIIEKGETLSISKLYTKEKKRSMVTEELILYEELLNRGIKEVKCWDPQNAMILDGVIIPYPSRILVNKDQRDMIIKVPNKDILSDYGILKDIL